jgi:hypothetical protein
VRRAAWERRYPRRDRRHRCVDCRVDITPESRHHGPRPGRWEPIPGHWHWYLVHDEVWALAGMEVEAWHECGGRTGGSGHLCIPCLEQRLGRDLTADDLIDGPISNPTDLDAPPLLRLKQERRGTNPSWKVQNPWPP